MMTQDEATAICNQMWLDSELTDPGLGAYRVICDLVRIAQNKTSPLAAVEAMEVLYALDPEIQGIDQARARELAKDFLVQHERKL